LPPTRPPHTVDYGPFTNVNLPELTFRPDVIVNFGELTFVKVSRIGGNEGPEVKLRGVS